MLDRTVTDWRAASDQLAFEGRAFINGRYVDALSGATRITFNPANGKELTAVANCGPEDADLAVAGARKAFASGVWSQMAPAERKRILVRWAELIEQHAEELALLECLDVGKPISDTLNVDVPSAVRTIRWSGEAIDKVYDEIAPTPAGTLALVQRLPLGVITAIVPWNFPFSTTAWKLGPSLGHRQLGGAQAGIQYPADGDPCGRAGGRSRAAGRCAAGPARTRRQPGQTPGDAHGY